MSDEPPMSCGSVGGTPSMCPMEGGGEQNFVCATGYNVSIHFVIYIVGDVIFCFTNRLLSRKEL